MKIYSDPEVNVFDHFTGLLIEERYPLGQVKVFSKSVVNNLKNSRKFKQIKLKLGVRLRNYFKVAKRSNKCFCLVASEQGPRPPQPQMSISLSIPSPAASMALSPFTEEESNTLFLNLLAKKPNDLNLISTWLIKKFSSHILHPLTKFIKLLFQTGEFPSLFKIAKVTATHERSKLVTMVIAGLSQFLQSQVKYLKKPTLTE